MGWNYTEKLVTLFQDAMNGSENSFQGRISNPDGIGHYGSIACGDAIVFSFKVEKDLQNPLKDRITEARYETFGCTSAIASSEALCYIIQETHPTPEEALSIKAEEIAKFLDGMPTQKMHCSVMGAEVLREAVRDWAKKRQIDVTHILPPEKHHDHSKLLCACFNRTEDDIKNAIEDLMITDLNDLMVRTQAGTGCGSCINKSGGLNDLLNEYKASNKTTVRPISAHDDRQNRELEAQVTMVIQTVIRPHLARTGRDFRLARVKGNLVYCEIDGHSDAKLITLIENLLRELVHPELRVVDF